MHDTIIPPFWKHDEIAEFGAGDCIHQIKLTGVHELADFFDMMEGKDYDDLKTSIKEHGLVDAIVISQDGVLLDGRNRLRACLETDTPRSFRLWVGSPMMLVMAKNVLRRHLTVGQRAAVASQLYDWHKARANEHLDAAKHTLAGLAGKLGVSPAAVKRVRKLRQEDEETYEKVRKGQVRLADPFAKRLAPGETLLPLKLPLETLQSVRSAADREGMPVDRWAAEALAAAADASRELHDAGAE